MWVLGWRIGRAQSLAGGHPTRESFLQNLRAPLPGCQLVCVSTLWIAIGRMFYHECYNLSPQSHVLDVRTEHPVLRSFLHCVMLIQLRPQTTVEASCPSISFLREKVCGWSSTVAWPFGVLQAEYLMTTCIFFTLDTNETSLVLVQYLLWNQTERCNPLSAGLPGQAKAAAFQECLSGDSWGTVHKKDGAGSKWLLSHIPEPYTLLPFQVRALTLCFEHPAKSELRQFFHCPNKWLCSRQESPTLHLALLLPTGCTEQVCKLLCGKCSYGETGTGRVSLTGAQGNGENRQTPASESLASPEVPSAQCLGNPHHL